MGIASVVVVVMVVVMVVGDTAADARGARTGVVGRLGSGVTGDLQGTISVYTVGHATPTHRTESLGGAIWSLRAPKDIPPLPSSSTPASTTLLPPNQQRTVYPDSDSEDHYDPISASGTGTGTVSQHDVPLAVACDDGAARLFTIDRTAQQIYFTKTFPPVEGRVLSVAWFPDRVRLAAGTSEGHVHVFSSVTGRELVRMTSSHQTPRCYQQRLCGW